MLYSVFPEFINMSLTASAVILILALIRPLLRRAPRAVTFLLWAVVLFRLVCPVSFSAEFSLLQAGSTVDHRIEYIPAQLVNDTLQLQSIPSANVLPHTVSEITAGAAGRTDFARLLLILATWGWIIGIAVFLVIGIVSLLRLRRKCIGAMRTAHNIYLADNITVPFVLGIFHPRIFLPSDLTDEQRVHILSHEEAHIRRGDPIWKLIAYLALTLHWFNPVVWLGFNLFVRDMEAACDERVLSGMNDAARADYAETLLRVAAGHRFPSITPAFGEDNPKTRIKTILRYKKPITIVTIISVILVLVIAAVLLVNPTAKTAPAAEVIEEFPNLSGDLFSVMVCSGEDGFSHGFGSNSQDDYRWIYSTLQNLQVEVNPASQSRSEDRFFPNTFSLTANKEQLNSVDFHFNSDFSRMWIDNGLKPSYTYVVAEPDVIRELFTVLLTGETENKVLETAMAANYVANDTQYITAMYCPPMQKDSAAIQIGTLDAGYVTQYLCQHCDWTKTVKPSENPASPESVEFVIEDELRVQIWKNPRLAVIREGETEYWFKTNYNDYSAAVDLVQTYSLTQEEVRQLLHPESATSAAPQATPNTTEPESSTEVFEDKPQATPSATAEPTPTPDPDSAQAETDIYAETIEEDTPTETDAYADKPSPTATPDSIATENAETEVHTASE